jgi:DMSO/TMAO reductase YedYZ molybdopterin-dependent catalytic subunit
MVRPPAEGRGVRAPPGPFRPGFWRSPLRGPWLTTLLGTLLLGGVTVVALTGFLSHAAYEPGLGRNGIVDPSRDLPLGIGWPAAPAWLYGLTQGLHVNVGLVTVPLLLAKLWSVIPRLFAWPPLASPAQAIERASITLLVSSAGFEFATGIVNAQNYYPFGFRFVVAHYYGAVVFIASLAVHVVVKLPVMVGAYRERGLLGPLREDLAATRPEPPDPDGLVARDPAPPTITRRGLLGFAGAGSGLLLLLNVGESIGGPLRPLALLAPRGGDPGPGPNGFQVNKTAAGAGIKREMIGDAYRLVLRAGERELRLRRADLLALEQRTEDLPIACVEGWTTTQRWTGVPLATLAGAVGAAGASELLVESLQRAGTFRQVTLTFTQFGNRRALLALKVNGADLSIDHGFPARVIVPALPGVHNTKWVAAMTFKDAA